MGLDQYAYRAARAGQWNEYWENADFEDGSVVNKAGIEKPHEIQYWRKHHDLHGWMEQLWRQRANNPDISFNGIELELTRDDLLRLRSDIEAGRLPETTGFFFGNGGQADNDYYRETDLKFIEEALADSFLGYKIFYNSSW